MSANDSENMGTGEAGHTMVVHSHSTSIKNLQQSSLVMSTMICMYAASYAARGSVQGLYRQVV